MLQEIAARSLTNNITITSDRKKKRDSGKRSILADKVSRSISFEMNGILRRAPNWESPNFWLTNIRQKQQSELLKILSLKDRKRLAKTLPAKEGIAPKANKIKKSDKAQRKREGRFREMETCLEAQQEIEKGLLPPNILGEISMPEALKAL